MRVPFALWSGVLALLVYAGFVGFEYMNFGIIDPVLPMAARIGGVWLALVILVGVAGMLRKAMTARPADLPDDVAREIRAHPEDG